jgi:hypothetical protein
MSGYNAILKVRQLEKECDELGFMMCHPRHYNSGDWGQLIAIKPKDSDSLPIYNRDAELFIGTLEQLEVWLKGVEWARQYDELLRLSNTKKRERKEQDQRNRNLIEILKQEAKVKVDE